MASPAAPRALRRLVLIALSCPTLLTGAPARAADAQVLDFGTIVVTGTPRSQEVFTSPADVDVLAGERKARIQRPSLGATLDRLPGVRSFDAGAQVGKPVIRGFTGNRIRVLSNGIGLDYQQFGIRHPPNVDPFLADRIEIVRGPASVLYGSDAIGGAVNVLHDPPPGAAPGQGSVEGDALGEYSSAYDMNTLGLRGAAAAGALAVEGRVVRRESGGLRTPDAPTALETGNPRDPLVTGDVPFTGFEQLNGLLAVHLRGAWGEAGLRYEGFRSEQDFVVGDPPPPDGDPLQPGGVGQHLENDLLQFESILTLRDGLELRPSVTRLRNLRMAAPGGAEPLPRTFLPAARVVDIERESLTARVVLDHDARFTGTSGQLGIEVFGIEQDSRGPVTIVPGGEIQGIGVFAFESWERDLWRVNAGLRFDQRTQEAQVARTADPENLTALGDRLEQDYTAVTGGLGVSRELAPGLVLATNLSTGFRAPTLFDLFANGEHGGVAAFQRGDPDLSEETALNLDGSLRWRSERWQVDLTAYRYWIDDYIFLAGTGETVPVSGLPIFQVTQDDAQLWGGDLAVSWRPLRNLTVSAVLEAVRGELDQTSADVPLLPADNLRVEITREWPRLGVLEDAYLTVGALWAADQAVAGPLEPFAQFDSPPPPFGTGSTEGYGVGELAAGARFGRARVRLHVDNLFDRAYRAYEDTYKVITLSPGRDVRLTVAFEL